MFGLKNSFWKLCLLYQKKYLSCVLGIPTYRQVDAQAFECACKDQSMLVKEFLPLLLFKFFLWDSLSLKWKFTILLSLAGQWALCICLILPLNTRVNACTVIIDLFSLLKTHTVYYACYFLSPIAIQTLHNSLSIKPLAIFLFLFRE